MSELRELIANRIRQSGPISFAEFMELSLYHPELGYYARAAQRTGRAGDFFTSVDVGPVFGELLARQFGEMWRAISSPQPFDIVEAGAGNGRLARDVLDGVRRTDPDCYSAIRLSLVEQSDAARAAQPEILGLHAPLLRHSASTIPDEVEGVIFANELLDALPTHVVMMTDSGLREIFVGVSAASGLSKPVEFVEQLEELSTPRITEYLSRAGATMHKGARAEVNLAAEDWIKQAAQSLRKGFMLLIDYGHDEAELYSGSHATGTLTSFRRHIQTADSLQEPGEWDLTSHVDLSAATRAAERSGLDVLGRLDQTYFLIGLGAAEIDGLPLKQRLALKTLLLPGGLGSTHKVLMFGKQVGRPVLKGLSYRVRMT